MVRFAKPHVSVISTDLGRNIMVLISLDFTKGNLIVRFGIPLISVIFKNSAAITNTRPALLGLTEFTILWGQRLYFL